MKIVIDIPEEDYKFIKEVQFYHSGRRSGKTIEQKVINAIKNGTPLPKGHGDLIDRKELAVTPIDTTDLPTEGCLMVYLAEDVDGAPTIIEADKETDND